MKVDLAFRSTGVHTTQKTIEIEVDPSQVVTVEVIPNGNTRRVEVSVDEDSLLEAIEKVDSDFLPAPVSTILLMVGYDGGGTAVRDPFRFRSWGKYFNAYSVTVQIPDEEYHRQFKLAAEQADKINEDIGHRVSDAFDRDELDSNTYKNIVKELAENRAWREAFVSGDQRYQAYTLLTKPESEYKETSHWYGRIAICELESVGFPKEAKYTQAAIQLLKNDWVKFSSPDQNPYFKS